MRRDKAWPRLNLSCIIALTTSRDEYDKICVSIYFLMPFLAEHHIKGPRLILQW